MRGRLVKNRLVLVVYFQAIFLRLFQHQQSMLNLLICSVPQTTRPPQRLLQHVLLYMEEDISVHRLLTRPGLDPLHLDIMRLKWLRQMVPDLAQSGQFQAISGA